MPFKQRFERQVNRNMRKGPQAGPAPRQTDDYDMDLKKGFRSPPVEEGEDEDVMDEEMHEKRDRPPRFSTIFGAPPAPAPAPIQYIERPPKRRSGVFMPMPLFVLFMLIIFFESTILFAYTILGIYNNAAPRLFGVGSTTVCPVNPQPYVNISPNFLMPQAPPVVTVTPLVTGLNDGSLPDMESTSLISTTTTTSSSSISTTSTPSTTSSSTTSSTSSTTSTTSTSATTSTTSTSDSTSSSSTLTTIESTLSSTTSAPETQSSTSSSTTLPPAMVTLTANVTVDAPQTMATVTSVVIGTPPAPSSAAASGALAAITALAGLMGPI